MQFRSFLLAAILAAAAYGGSMNIIKENTDCAIDVIDVNDCTGTAKIGRLLYDDSEYMYCDFFIKNPGPKYQVSAPICNTADVALVNNSIQFILVNQEGQQARCNPPSDFRTKTPPYGCTIVS